MFRKAVLYEKLQGRAHEPDGPEDEESILTNTSDFPSIPKILITILLTFSLFINLIMLYSFASYKFDLMDGLRHRDQMIYSPAEDRITYKVKKFESGFTGERTPYQGPPSTENNKLWENLHGHGPSHISKSQAVLLPNKTIADQSGGENNYLVVLSVFHHLHCLDKIRKGMYYFFDEQWNASSNPYSMSPSIFAQQGAVEKGNAPAEGVPQMWHLDHCIDSLRQALQCASDVSPYVFQWSESDKEVRAFADGVHTCRDFDAIRAWGEEHQSPTILDASLKGDEQGLCRHNDVDC